MNEKITNVLLAILCLGVLSVSVRLWTTNISPPRYQLGDKGVTVLDTQTGEIHAFNSVPSSGTWANDYSELR
ncbi:hypothetical protein CCAX7_14990 [Capsulimonas corticalis]|uniref:Uncharacterized protein n=1 Tax=Capsulimonas corticalis TaxID=2219043 RepID=A0A402CZE1_9BACT|nr:hypothetical protein [Capsulimonas corticalis]BDI29448.1 hypothetical protein CCAX7_14990 [Capsulimonas corticalis]